MVLVPSKPSYLIGIIEQPLEDCTSKFFKAARYQVHLVNNQIENLS
jgi:hypothetical protein